MKQYFKGKTGCLFWLNVLLAAAIVSAVPIVLYFTIDSYTHHGEQITVPAVVGQTTDRAIEVMETMGLEAYISDSVYDKSKKPGEILDQSPKSGTIVKTGHIIHLTANYTGAPMVRLPDLVGNSSRLEAEMILKSLGCKLGTTLLIYGQPEGQVVAVKQGGKNIRAGQMLNKEKVVVLVCGAGIQEAEEDVDTLTEEELERLEGYTSDSTEMMNVDAIVFDDFQ